MTAVGAEAPPEPHSYRMEDYRAPTPPTLEGARVLTTEEADEIWQAGGAAFIDVLPQAPRPANLRPEVVWRDKPRFDIPGSVWLPDTGYGALAPIMDSYFWTGLRKATAADPQKTIVFYCLRNCWMSWNAAKRDGVWISQGRLVPGGDRRLVDGRFAARTSNSRAETMSRNLREARRGPGATRDRPAPPNPMGLSSAEIVAQPLS